MYSRVIVISFLLLYHSPPQKASGRTVWPGPTVQHLHRHLPPICTLSRCGTCASGFLFPPLASLPTIFTRVDFLFSINNCCLCIPQKIATIFMYFTCISHLFLLLYHSPPQKASGRTVWPGPTVQHLHRHLPPMWTLSRCGTLTFSPSSSSIPTISTRVDFLFSVNFCYLCIHQKLHYNIYVLTCKSHLFSVDVSYSSTKSFWKNWKVRADFPTPPSPTTISLYVISLWDFDILRVAFFPLLPLYPLYLLE